MSADSIFSNLTAENTAAEISLILSADYKRKKTVILLEGEDDVKAFRFLVSRDVTLIKAYGASTTVDKFMPENFPDEKRVIGIRDRDYQEKKKFGRIFYCDHCCCEMMLISDDETFQRVAVNFYRGRLSPDRLRYELLKKLFYISALRLCSDRYRWALRISDTDLNKIVNPRVSPGKNAVVAFVNAYNPKNKVDGARLKKLALVRDTGRLEDYLDITNGHDFVEALRIYCAESSSGNKRRSISDKALAGAIRCAYSLRAFENTRLYAELKLYGEENGLSIVAE
ncbi:MAG: hypothetical protein ACLSUT_01435 [Christensenellales bacterium]|jgi:hypothetical protein